MPNLRFIGLLRVWRSAAFDLQRSLQPLLPQSAGPGPADLDAAVADLGASLGRNKPHVAEVCRQIEDCLEKDDVLIDANGDDYGDLLNLWDRAIALLDPITVPGAAAGAAPRAGALLEEFVLRIGMITAPVRLAEKLLLMRPGQVLDFSTAFATELPTPAAQRTVLSAVAAEPALIPGLVDLPGLRIWAVSPRRWRRWLSPLLILAVAAVVAAAFGLLLPRIDPFRALSSSTLVGAFVLALAGGVGHIGLDALKQVRDASALHVGGSDVAIGQWALWVHVREQYLMASVVSVGIAAGAVLLKTSDPLAMLLAGYSADSIVDAVLPKFTTALNKRSAALTADVGQA